MSMLIKLFIGFLKYIFFGSFIIIYIMSFYNLITISFNLIQSSMPNKIIVFAGVIIYLIHLIVLFLLYKVYFDKSVIKSLFLASLTNGLVVIVFGIASYYIFKTDFILFEFDIKTLLSEMNYNTRFKKIDKKVDLTTKELFDLKKAFNIYFYVLILLFVSDTILAYKIYKNKFYRFF